MKRIKNFLKSLIFQYKQLSIFRKFLLSPFIAFMLFIPFYMLIVFSVTNMKQSSSDINLQSVPAYEIANEDIRLLELISYEINSALSAKESEWIDSCDDLAVEFKNNLFKLEDTKYDALMQKAISSFDNYYTELKPISKKILLTNHNYNTIDQDSAKLVDSYKNIKTILLEIKNNSKEDIQIGVKKQQSDINFLMFYGLGIFFILFSISLLIVYFIYKDIKKRLQQIILESNHIATHDSNFKSRLKVVSYDELGVIVKSINRFINKLHKKHKTLEKTNLELESLYIKDKLTNIYNRTKIDELLEIEINKKKRYDSNFSIILIDIDYFKQINDTYGHLVGDELLKNFASLLRGHIRECDFVGRWGGEEFIVIATNTTQKSATTIAEHLREKIKEYKFVRPISASFGLAISTQNDTIKSIISRADNALYEAKHGGRDKICFGI